MKVLGISGSHRADGGTAFLVKRALEVCEEKGLSIEYVSLAEKDIDFCSVCDYCAKNPECIKKDDCAEVLSKMRAADAIIIGSPTYFGSVSARLKNLFDRTLPLRRNGFALAGKIGGAIAVGGSRNGGQEYVVRDIHNFMLIHRMTVVPDAGNSHFGGIASGRSKEDVESDETGVKTVEGLAENMAEILLKKK